MLNHMKIYHYHLNKNHLLSTLLMAALFVPPGVTAGIYKWTDEQGKVHYGSQRPADAAAERLKINADPSPYSDPAEAEETDKDAKKESDKESKDEKKKEAEAKKRAEAEAAKAAEKPQISRKEKQKLCAQARANVQTIESRGRVRVKDEAGNSRHLTDQERSKELAASRKNVSKYCK